MITTLSRATPVIVQGITGRMGRAHANLMRAYGTNIVGGTSTRATPDLTSARNASRLAVSKKNGISTAAVSGASDPCTALRSMFSANCLRIVPSAAFAGFVAPIKARQSAIAFSFSSAITTTMASRQRA